LGGPHYFLENEEMASNTIVPPAPVSRASDDEILGLTTNPGRKARSAASGRNGQGRPDTSSTRADADDLISEEKPAGNRHGELSDVPGDVAYRERVPGSDDAPEQISEILNANPELRDAWNDARAYREVFSTPAQAQEATKLLGDLNRIDALFYSRQPEDHAELARAVSQLDPQAFASLARAMNDLAGGPSGRATVREVSVPVAPAPVPDPARQTPATKAAESETSTPGAAAGVSNAQSDFFHSTNAAAVRGVMDAIETQVDRLLPEGISKSARNRVVGEIYRELDTTLQGNRGLGQQMRDVFRSGALDDAHRRAIVSLVTGRARQALPGVAKRVLNEWTNTIVSANQERRTRQRTAERRVDISGSGGGNNGRKAVSSRDIDYGRMSDGDILNL
jgi:hypothetical protein